MNVLVTGASGFIGSNLIPELSKKGYEVHSLQRYVTGRYNDRDKNTHVADLRDYAKVRDIIAELKPEFVIHLAAISPAAYSYTHQLEIMDVNFHAAINLAEANRELNPFLNQFLAAGTSEEYGIQKEFPIKESADLRPGSPYAVSKVAMDKYLRYMYEAFNFPVTVLRPFNTYGRRSNTHFVVERILSQMLTSDKIQLGNPKPIRDFLYRSDHVDAYLTCLGNEKAIGRTFNFCTQRGTSIGELAMFCADATEFRGEIQWDTGPTRPLDQPILVGDNTKARELLNWRPKVSLEEGLMKTVFDLRSNLWPTPEQQK